MSRDDKDWTTLYDKKLHIIALHDVRNGKLLTELRVNNTVIKLPGWAVYHGPGTVQFVDYTMSIGGTYEKAEKLNVIVQNERKVEAGPKMVLNVDNWKSEFVPGKWQDIIKVLIREYL